MAVVATRIALILCVALVAAALSGCNQEQEHEEETIVIRFSRFEPGTLTVRAGTTVTLSLRNDDPIEHEWIVGNEETHSRHRNGTEPYHDRVPHELTVPAFSTRQTTLTFEEPGDYLFICHLPGHESYGMRGMLRVLPD